MSGGTLARRSGRSALTQEPRPLPSPDYSGETQRYVRRQKAAEEQKRFDKGFALSRTPSRTFAARQFTTSVNLVWRLLPFRVVYEQLLPNLVKEGLPTTRS